MDTATVFLLAHPFWLWVALGVVLLAAELATGTGWLLWPAACAGLLALITLAAPISPAWAVLLFAVLTIVTTILSRRVFTPANPVLSPDINDPMGRMIGHVGAAVTVFTNGAGRVFVDGKEWAAEADPQAVPALEQRVEVTAVKGAILLVRAV